METHSSEMLDASRREVALRVSVNFKKANSLREILSALQRDSRHGVPGSAPSNLLQGSRLVGGEVPLFELGTRIQWQKAYSPEQIGLTCLYAITSCRNLRSDSLFRCDTARNGPFSLR